MLPSFQRAAATDADLTRPSPAAADADGMWPPSGSEPSSEDEREPRPASSEDEADDPELAPEAAARQPLPVSWLDLSAVGHPRSVAVCGAPGGPGRSLSADLDRLAALGFTAVLLLCTPAELAKLGLSGLSGEYAARGLTVCHRPVSEGEVPETQHMLLLFEAAAQALEAGGRVLLHCSSGLGRSCTVAACLLLHVDEQLTSDQAVEAVRRLRGPRAVQSVRQYNYIQEYREERDLWMTEQALPESRPVSR